MRRNDRAESNTEFSPMSHVFTLYLYPDEKSYRWCLILDTMVGFAEEFEEHGPGPGAVLRWDGYERLRDGILAYLEAGPEGDAPRGSRSNLESALIAWNKERGPDPNRLADYLREHGVSVLDKYGKYFPSLPRPPRPDSPAS